MIHLDPVCNLCQFHIVDEFDTNPNDLHLIDAVKLTHNAMCRPAAEIPNFLADRSAPPNQANVSEPDSDHEYWVIRNGEPVLRTFDRTAVAGWIRENGTKGLKVLVPVR